MDKLGRVRWAAIGAAVAITLGASGIGIARATSPDGAAAFVPITPCRLFDTRPDFQVGARSAALGPNDSYDVTATGQTGDCDLPAGARGVVLNVTAVAATEPTFLTLWPAGEERPNASSLNPTPGAPPTPNAVTTNLNSNGAFSIYNLAGSVHVLADAVGYYTDHDHDDRYYTEAEVDTALATAIGAIPTVDGYTREEVDAALAAKADTGASYTTTESDARYATGPSLRTAVTELEAADAAQKFVHIDPLTVFTTPNSGAPATPNGSWNVGGGLRIDDVPPGSAGPGIDITFIVPADYTSGERLTLEVLWYTPSTACSINLTQNYGGIARRGGPLQFEQFGFRIADPVPSVANTLARSTFEMRPTEGEVRPGDVISMGIFRSGNDDTCNASLYIKGLRVLYA